MNCHTTAEQKRLDNSLAVHFTEIQLFFRPNVRLGKKCDLSGFNCGMIVGARQGELSISETADLGFSCTAVSRVCREWCEKQKTSCEQQFPWAKNVVNEKGPKRRATLVKADRKVVVMHITIDYNSGMQKSISEHTTRQTSKRIGYSSRRLKSNKYLIKSSLHVYKDCEWGSEE